MLNSCTMAEHSEVAQNSEHTAAREERCQFVMWRDRPRCGRPIHRPPPGVDEEPLCLMHSRDLNKSDEDFQAEFDRTLQEAGEDEADFTGFVFPGSGYSSREFWAKCIFAHTRFTREARFIDTKFRQDANFIGATFEQGATFIWASFKQVAYFGDTKFEREASFDYATFTQKAYFKTTSFKQNATFSVTKFGQGADFTLATFTQRAAFYSAKFEKDADFSAATFSKDAHFGYATFAHAKFCRARFTKDADFPSAAFTRVADFSNSRFAEVASFQETTFIPDATAADREPCPVFTNAAFERPERVKFYKVSLRHALFHNCDMSRVEFSNVEWLQRKNGKYMVLEEEVDLSQASELRPVKDDPNERNYLLIGQIYHRLKKNCDDVSDYATAGDFHYGELEMKRLHSPHKYKLLRWLHQSLGLVAWYKYASDYGENYVKPGLWLVLVILIFALLYPALGLLHGDPGRVPPPEKPAIPQNTAHAVTGSCLSPKINGVEGLSYWCPSDKPDASSLWRSRLYLFGNSFMTSLYVAAFQKDLDYQPSYPQGRLLALIEVLLTSTLAALFLLAVRRQFKR